MKKMRHALTRHGGVLTVSILSAVTYLLLTILFFALMGINNWPLRHLNRTSVSTMLTWLIMLFGMHNVYGGYDIGKKKSKPITYNMVLGTVFADLVTYLQLQIMNTNPNYNSTLNLLSADLLWLLLCMVLQGFAIMGMVRGGNELYFRINPPRKCLLIINDPEEELEMKRKIGRFRLQWQVTKTVLWNHPQMEKWIAEVDVVFIGSVPDEKRMTLLRSCYDQHRDVLSRANVQEIMLSGSTQQIVDDMPFLEMDYHKITMSQRVMKRGMDVLLCGIALILLSPLMLLIGLLIHWEDGGPAFFRQKRMTMGGREFEILKFRSMKVNSSEVVQISAQQRDPRITRIGKVIRRTRLDELPQLINILRGEMSIVGPRPEMLENVEKYKMALPTFVYREKMKAGLTGYAQIEGKYNTSPEDKLMLDLMYIERFSIWEDVKLILRTFTVLFKKESTEGFTTEEKK